MATLGSSCVIIGYFTILFFQHGDSEPLDLLRKQISDRIWIHVYSKARMYDRIPYEDVKAITKLQQYKIDKATTIIYFPGWTETPENQESINYVTDALLQRDDVKVLVVDYSQSLQGDDNLQYLRSYINSSTVGYLMGKWLVQLKKLDSNENFDKKVRLVGHSMGAHIISFATKVYGRGLLRITALDPAYPLYFGPLAHLTAADGSFVDVIHTDAAALGHPDSLGHADFFPNDGVRLQPFCKTPANKVDVDFCSHHMSWRYWAESARPKQGKIFLATGCKRQSPCLIPSTCSCAKFDGNLIAFMGYDVDTTARGDFSLVTGTEPPFGLHVDSGSRLLRNSDYT